MATKKQNYKDYLDPQRGLNIQKPEQPKPAQSLELKDIVNKPGTKNLVDKSTGKVTGFEYAPGKFVLPKGNAPTQEQQMQVEAQKKTAQAQFETPQIDLSNVGQLTPEQQALINAPVDVNRKPNLRQILNSAGESAAKGAAGVAVGGAAVGSVVPGIGTLAGAGIGALAGAITGAVTGTFQAYKYKDVDNAKGAEANYFNSKESINGAITLARRGGAQDLAETEFNNAKTGLYRTQKLYKSLEKNREWATDIKDKQVELDYYINNVLPRKEAELRLALLKPNPDYIGDEVNQVG
jgi:hypothetical protein